VIVVVKMSSLKAAAAALATASPTSEMAELAEEMATFFEDEKLRAQNRIRRCEMFINDSRLASKSIREGLHCLLRNAEDDYSTLLHLERVMNMREGGDFRGPDNPTAHAMAMAAMPTTSDVINRRSLVSADDDDEDPFEGQGFVMGETTVGGQVADLAAAVTSSEPANNVIGDDELDPFFAVQDDTVKSPAKRRQRKSFKRPSITGDQLDEIQEAEDLDAEEPAAAAPLEIGGVGGGRQIHGGVGVGGGKVTSVAHSLPVSIPLPEFRNRLLDSDLDEEEEEDGEKRDIPKKIAEIARSLYDQVEEIASSPNSIAKFTQNI